MKVVKVIAPNHPIKCSIDLPASKSIANRALILQALYPNIQLDNISTADDTLLMQEAIQSSSNNINLKNAGTCMRFLTAFFATQEGKEITLNCDERMKQRPIKTLVNALLELGAEIEYVEKKDYPPLLIKGKRLIGKSITINASESSQFITALMLIAPTIENGLEIIIEGEIASKDYIEMTLKLMREFGLNVYFENNKISISNQQISKLISQQINIEPDWSSAAFWYQMAALSKDAEITLNQLSLESIQGDKRMAELFSDMVSTKTILGDIVIKSEDSTFDNQKLYRRNMLRLYIQHQPDLAPALVVTLAALGIEANILGLQNLKLKESNRLKVLHDELNKLGFKIEMNEDSINITNQPFNLSTIQPFNQIIQTYNDHRMAMAFAPLALVFGEVLIENPDVVEKSYPHYWHDLQKAGFGLEYFEV